VPRGPCYLSKIPKRFWACGLLKPLNNTTSNQIARLAFSHTPDGRNVTISRLVANSLDGSGLVWHLQLIADLCRLH
jgi:hypothetical protein